MATIKEVNELKSKIDALQTDLRSKARTLSPEQRKACGREIRTFQAELGRKIAEGANPCPDCGRLPFGMEQPRPGGGVEFEVGCLTPSCGWFIHTDGTVRGHAARGGLLPHHAVEAWNEGPDAWKKLSPRRDTPEFRAKLKERKAPDAP